LMYDGELNNSIYKELNYSEEIDIKILVTQLKMLARALKNAGSIWLKILITKLKIQLFCQLFRRLIFSFNNKMSNEPTPIWENFSQNQKWIDNLRIILIEHRSIGHEWQLSDVQIQNIRHYYHSNITLVQCLNCASKMSGCVREQIEEALLLPMVEIEKRKRENIE
uniref:NACHT C-terminal helical domain 2-containing protein n=1 Tax=Calothrix rhizosoleniae TaxID=888997 RepID=UPI00389958CE